MPPLFTMLTIKNLTKSHAGRTLFRETEMTINWGERVALVGPNGAGKSTLFRMILGEDTPDEGSINMDEYAMVGYLPQEASEPKDETVLEIAMGITPEMERAIHVIRTAENANKTDTPEYAEAIDTFNAANGSVNPEATGIRHAVEASEDLQTWTETAEVKTEGKSSATFRDAVPMNAESPRRRFLRLKISREGESPL